MVEPARHLAWRTVGLWGHVESTEWRITLEPQHDGTRIVQTYDVVHVAPGVDRVYWLLITAHRDRSEALVQDVDRLARIAEAAHRPEPLAVWPTRVTCPARRGRPREPDTTR